MKKIIISIFLSEIFIISAQAITCPTGDVVCIRGDTPDSVICSVADNGVHWVYDQNVGPSLPEPYTKYYFNTFTNATDVEGSHNNGAMAICNYVNTQNLINGSVSFYSAAHNIYADLHAEGTNWITVAPGFYTCSSPEQTEEQVDKCPLTILAK